MSDPGYELVQTPDGVDLVVLGAWSQSTANVITSGRADGLVLNYAKGFRERDLKFVEGLPVKRLSLLARTHKDLNPIYSLAPNLVEVSLQTAPTVFDLSRLPLLTKVGAPWGQIRDSVASLSLLVDLFVLSYSEWDLAPLRWNGRLRSIRMKDRPVLRSLDGVEVFDSLERLELPLAPIEDLSPLRAASTSIRRLDFESCRLLDDLGPLEGLVNLRRINFSECGDLESVKPLEKAQSLEHVVMWGSTRVVDGDLSPLAALPLLKILRMRPRKIYTPSVELIKESIGDL